MTSTILALTLAGIFTPFLLQVLKKWLQWQGMKALALAAVTSWIIAIASMWATGELTDARQVFLAANAVFGLTQIVFKTFREAGLFAENTTAS